MSLTTFIQKGEALAVLVEKKMETAAQDALPITEKIMAALQSPAGLIVEGLIPNGATYTADAVAAITAAIPALKLLTGIGDRGGTNGLLQRLGSTLTAIIHGGKYPFTYYVAAFEFVCFGTNAKVAA